MKKNLLVITFLLVTVFAFGQKLPFQGKLILNGAPVTTPQTFVFEINSIGWSETHTDVPVTDGLYFVVLGNINPLPDSLFYGVTEQNMNITVDGTALSPVVLFKPLSSPFEGSELSVRNSEGTIVGKLSASNDSVNKNGLLEVFGTNGNRNMRIYGGGEGGNFGAFTLHDDQGLAKANMFHYGGAGIFTVLGKTEGAIQGGFKAWEGEEGANRPFLSFEANDVPGRSLARVHIKKQDSVEYGQLLLYSNDEKEMAISPTGMWIKKNGATLAQSRTQNYSGLGEAGDMSIRGPNSRNVSISNRHWENPDLPFIGLYGEGDFQGIELSITRDEENNQFGWINLMSENGKNLHLSPDGFGVEGVGMSTVNHANGNFGRIDLSGPNSNNIQLMPDWWVKPDMGFLQVNGTSNGRVELEVNDDGNGNGEYGLIHLYSDAQKSIRMEPTSLAFRDDANSFHHLLDMGSNNNSGNGWFGFLNLRGPGSDNIQMGARDWEGKPDLPIINLLGEGEFHATEFSVYNDGNGYQHGFLNIKSSDGRTAELNPNILAFHNNAGSQTVVLETKDNGQGDFGELRLNGPSGNPALKFTDSGGTGLLTVYGETGGGIKSGFKWWEGEGGENRPFQALEGTVKPNFGLIYSHILGDNTVEHGQIELYSTNGSRADINAYQLTFDDTEQVRTYDVNGISGSGQLSINNGVNITGDLVANGSVLSSSDIRLKKNISPIKGSLEKIELIKGVSYNWRQDEFPEKNFSSNKQIGVIAQDLEAQFPALVKTDKDGYKSVNYNGFTAVLLEAVKELNAKVEKLETENMQLKAELSVSANNSSDINRLKQQMEMLSKMVQQNSTVESSSVNEIVSTPGLK